MLRCTIRITSHDLTHHQLGSSSIQPRHIIRHRNTSVHFLILTNSTATLSPQSRHLPTSPPFRSTVPSTPPETSLYCLQVTPDFSVQWHWHLVIKTSWLGVKKTQSASQYYLLWMSRHVGTRHWSCFLWAYLLQEFTCKVFEKAIFSDYRPLFITRGEWNMFKNVMEVLRLSQYWTLWMSKRHTVILPQIITVSNNIFDHKDGVMQVWAKMKTQWNINFFSP
jgi:hypothetical protein